MYAVTINRDSPACLIVLVDQSGSMNRRVAGTAIPRRMAAADAVNSLLNEALMFAQGERSVRHYFDVGIFGYGGGQGDVRCLLGEDLLPFPEVFKLAKPRQQRFAPHLRWHESARYLPAKLPVWLDPAATGQTAMRAAFERGLAVVKTWTRQHPFSFPPIVVNITGGSFAGISPAPLASEIRELTTEDGNTVVFNCHISDTEDIILTYPGPSNAADLKGWIRQLYEMSSVLPEQMRETAHYQGYDVDPGARGYILNADIRSIFNFIQIGTRPALY